MSPATWNGQEWIERAGAWKELATEYPDATPWEPGVHYQAPTFTTNSVFSHAGRFWLPRQTFLDAADNRDWSPTSAPDYWLELPVWRSFLPQVAYGRAPIGALRTVSREDPRVYGEPSGYSWTSIGSGQWSIRDGLATRYWVEYRLVTPTLAGEAWDDATEYTAAPLDEQLYRTELPPAVAPGPAATPTFSPAAGTYVGAQTVTVSSATSGATLYYTLDGSAPTTDSAVYVGPVEVAATQTLRAIAVKAGLDNSAAAAAHFVILASDQIYWGTSGDTTLDAAGILALSGTRTALDPAGAYAFTPPAEEYLYLAWPDDLPDQPLAATGFMAGPFPAVMADGSAGYDQEENGWNYKVVTVDGVAYRLYRSFWPIALEITITVNT